MLKEKKEKDTLEAMFYWVKVIKKIDKPEEKQVADATIRSLLNQADKLEIPYSIQNQVIQAAKEQVNRDRYFADVLNIILSKKRTVINA